jgi:hypothetical protein
MFPTTYCGEESWSALYDTLQNSISDCTISVRQKYKCRSSRRKLTYHLSCQHGHEHQNVSKVINKENLVGLSNVPTEHLKSVKKSENNCKGMCISMWFVYPTLRQNLSLIITMFFYPSTGTKGMTSKKQKRVAAKKQLIKLKIESERKEMG